MIRFINVTKQYPNGQYGLQDVTLEIPANRLSFITGPTGAGKSTAARLIALRDQPTGGQIFVGETDLGDLAGRNIARYRKSIGILFPDLPLLNDRNVGDNVALPLMIESAPAKRIQPRVKNALDLVGLQSKLNFYPEHLSDAEQQRVRIARAVITRPVLIIADEPTANMDSMLGAKIMAIFKRLAGRNTTVIITTHNRTHFADKRHPVFELRQGQFPSTNQNATEQYVT